MRRMHTAALIISLMCLGTGCERNAARGVGASVKDSSDVAELVHERLRAALAGDTAAWHRLVSDSCLWSGGALRVSTTKEVLGSIAANQLLRPAAQQIRELVVYVSDNVAQAAYVQLVQDTGQAEQAGKRFRKVDTFVRRNGTWLLVGAAENSVPFRARIQLSDVVAERMIGRYALGDIDTLEVQRLDRSQFTMRGRDGAIDTLFAESDSVLFTEGDAGSWVFTKAFAKGPLLVYRSSGAADVVLTQVRAK